MTYRELLSRNADFRRLWTGQVVSDVGDWLNNIAVFALTIQLAGEGHAGRAVAVFALARHLPLFVFGPLAGVVVDRVDRRRVMLAADLARAVLALGFLVADRLGSLPLIYAVGAAIFSVSSFFNAARRASIPNLVRDPSEILSANALTASTAAATIAVGSALGGLVSTVAGRELVFALNALTFVASAEMIRRIRTKTRREEAERAGAERGDEPPRAGVAASFLRRAAVDFRDGLRYVRGDHVVASVFAVCALWGLGSGAGRAVYSLFGAWLGAREMAGWVERPTDFGISVLFVAMGLGGTLGAPAARRINQSAGGALERHLGRSMVFDGAGLALLAFVPNLWGASLVLVLREINFAVWWTAQQTLLMKRTDDRFAGRVFATFETVVTLMMVGAMLASGLAADTYGFRVVAAAGGACVVVAGLLWFLLRRGAAFQQTAARGINV
ncbi:MAG TPA: MFS transporter [Pyrinomonadaceae bacterium]|nr:MFS transporter [Pyrinomonadaceae bacterium]